MGSVGRPHTQRASVAMSEELQSAKKLMNTAHWLAKLMGSWRRGGNTQQVLFPEWPLFQPHLLLFAAAILMLYLIWYDYCVEGSHCIYYSALVPWENPTHDWAIYLHIILKIIFIRAMMLS